MGRGGSWERGDERCTVVGLTATTVMGPSCLVSDRTYANRLRSQMIHVLSADPKKEKNELVHVLLLFVFNIFLPVTIMLHSCDTTKHNTVSLWPHRAVASTKVSAFSLLFLFGLLHTFTTKRRRQKISKQTNIDRWRCD